MPHRPRRLRATLLLVTAFVATVTAVISGVRLVADLNRPAGAPSDLGDVPPCPPNSDCSALFPPRATPAGTGTPVPTGEPAGGASAAPSGSPTAPDTAEPPTPVPSPRGSRTATARPSPKPSPTGTARDSGVRLRPSPSPTPPRTASPSPRPTDPEPEPTRTERPPLQAVVKFIVLGARDGRYSAEIAIGNDGSGDLDGWEISLPIDGRVLAVDGARAVQRGDTLVLRSAEPVPSGGGVAVRITVRGEPTEPEFCRLRGGSCRILPDRG